jgi:hypothetical protein
MNATLVRWRWLVVVPFVSTVGCSEPASSNETVDDTTACAAVTPRRDVPPWQMRLAGSGPPRIAAAGDNIFLRSPSGRHELGLRMSWGGSATFFGVTGDSNSNVIDTYDRGRELQLALYDAAQYLEGCAATASCASRGPVCPETMSYLGWDPVEAGDRCGNGATGRWTTTRDGLRVVTQPLQWNPYWDANDCATGCGVGARVAGDVTFEEEYRFLDENVVEMSFAVTNHGERTREHDQEFPTFYVSSGPHAGPNDLPTSPPDLVDAIDANGDGISFPQGKPITIESRSLTSGNAWVAWQDRAHGYGVTFATDEGISTFRVFHESFYNVRPRIHVRIDAGAIVRGRAYIALGDLATASAAIDHVLSKRPPFGAIDAPFANATQSYAAGAPITVSGWVLDSTQIHDVHVKIDGKLVATIPVDVQRDDVCALYPAYAGCPNFFAGAPAQRDRTNSSYVGYDGSVPTAGLSHCAHLLEVSATDDDGNTTLLGERAIEPR